MQLEIILKNGTIIDGTGNPGYRADIGINAGKIVKIGRLADAPANQEFDLTGKVVCPGFIDIHSHNDFSIFSDPRGISTIRQGITTVVIGNCGHALAPVHPEKVELVRKLTEMNTPEKHLNITWNSFKEFLTALDQVGSAINVVSLVGFANIRIAGGPGYEARPPTTDELETMQAYVNEAMQAGAFGMSTGLIFTPQVYAQTEEVIELAKVVAQHGGLYFTHIRGEGPTVVEAVKEAIKIVELSGCRGGQIAHHKIAGKSYWGTSKVTLRLIEEANARGVNITCDQYPYTRGMGALSTMLPTWSHEGGIDKLLERLHDPNIRTRIMKEVTEGAGGRETYIGDVGWDEMFIAGVSTEKWKEMEGKSITEITQLKGYSDAYQTIFELLMDEQGEVVTTFECMGAEDIHRIMIDRHTMFATDGWAVAPTGVLSQGPLPHPRSYGTYPRILGKYVREEGILSLEEAIRKMTSFPAQRLGLFDRGLLREGMWADVVVFNPATVIDKATYEKPHQFSEGIHHVIVNGRIVVEDNIQNDDLPGQILRPPI